MPRRSRRQESKLVLSKRIFVIFVASYAKSDGRIPAVTLIAKLPSWFDVAACTSALPEHPDLSDAR
jgi:hypothetical protein